MLSDPSKLSKNITGTTFVSLPVDRMALYFDRIVHLSKRPTLFFRAASFSLVIASAI